MRGRNARSTALLLLLVLVGCVRTRRLVVAAGAYRSVVDNTSGGQIQGLSVERETATVLLLLTDGGRIRLAFTARPPAQWPRGCPTNLFDHAMEVLDLSPVGSRVPLQAFADPVLVRACPAEPEELFLCDAAALAGFATGAGRGACLKFVR